MNTRFAGGCARLPDVAAPVLFDVARPSIRRDSPRFKIAGGCARRTTPVGWQLRCQAARAGQTMSGKSAVVRPLFAGGRCARHTTLNHPLKLKAECPELNQSIITLIHLALRCFAAAPRAGLPLCGSGPDSVWQNPSLCPCMVFFPIPRRGRGRGQSGFRRREMRGP